MTKDKPIKMTRKELQDSRYTYGIDRKYAVDKPSINNNYNHLKRLSKLQIRGDKTNENEKV